MKFLTAALAACPFFAAATLWPASQPEIAPRAGEVEVKVPGGTIIGAVTEVESFNGIPFADPPVNELRLKPPRRREAPLGLFNATGFAPGCPQMPPNTTEVRLPRLNGTDMTPPLWPDDLIKGQEDCLTVTVQRPKGTREDANLPVLFYIFGGGFMFGAANVNNAENLIKFGVDEGQPFIFVAVNYRVGGFGFLGGDEVLRDGSTNLGLRDQRLGLEWVADNIVHFGGDPTRVTVWGQSSGSISVFDQMALYNGNATYKGRPLFRGAIMNSGSVIPTEKVDSRRAQAIFDAVVEAANCTHSTKISKLECLRDIPFERYYHAANSVPRILDNSSLALSYLPRPDGDTLRKSTDVLVKTGQYYAVPVILASQEDEGTLFAFAQRHVTSTDRLVDYLSQTFFDRATRELVAGLVGTYPIASGAGSPFRTGLFNEWYQFAYGAGNGFKRVAAILGDFVFTLARRLALDGMAQSNPDVALWSSMSTVLHNVAPFYGTVHGTDVQLIFEGKGLAAKAANSTRKYYINFVYNLDPNVPKTEYRVWPRWTPKDRQMLWTTLSGNLLMNDTFRTDSYEFLKTNTELLYF